MTTFNAADVRLPQGVRDFLPAAATARRRISDRVHARFNLWGYQQIITPQLEIASVLDRGLGDAARRGAVRFLEPEGDVVILRPDITPQVARIAATRFAAASGPLRFCYDGMVIRHTVGARIQRELLQAGVELLGVQGVSGDAEVVALAAEVLLATGVSQPRLELGHVGPSRLLFAQIESEAVANELTTALERRDRGAAQTLTRGLGIEVATLATALPRLCGPLDDVEVRTRNGRGLASVRAAIRHIRFVLAEAKVLSPEAMEQISVVVDLGEVRGFPYYTGLRLAGWLPGVGDAALVGGRYDNLVARYGRDLPATGFAVDIEHVAAAVGEHHQSCEGVLIAGSSAFANTLAVACRLADIRCGRIGIRSSISAMKDYAVRSGFDTVVVVSRTGIKRYSMTSDTSDKNEMIQIDTVAIETAIDSASSGNPRGLTVLLRGKNK